MVSATVNAVAQIPVRVKVFHNTTLVDGKPIGEPVQVCEGFSNEFVFCDPLQVDGLSVSSTDSTPSVEPIAVEEDPLNAREDAITAKEAELNARENELNAREDAVRAIEAELNAKLRDLFDFLLRDQSISPSPS